jgi:hypothetical protein
MICPRCHAESEGNLSLCPECGLKLMRSISGVMKTSAVMIAAGREHGFYRSVQEVPEPLRTQLIASTSSPDAGTILIADRAGKEQLTQVIARREAQRAGHTEAPEPIVETVPAPRELFGFSWITWAGLLLVLAIICVIAAAFGLRW